jgi:scavenger receptor class B protein 1
MLKNDSPAFKIWIEPTKQSSVHRKYYLFNITNADALVSGLEKKPNLVEMGPYVYKEKLEKKDVSFLDDETIRYSPVTTLTFDSALSNGSLDENVTFFNVPAWVRFHKMRCKY